MKKRIYLYSGEGTKHSESNYRLLKHSDKWADIKSILKSRFNLDLQETWTNEIGKHSCPISPLLTVVSQICLSDIWTRWGYKPDVVVGHSIGELTAAYQAGLYSLEDILLLTYSIGKITSTLNGVMLHGKLSDHEIENLPVNLSSYNFVDGSDKHVTLSGYADEMEDFLKEHPEFVKMRIPHPWHHPEYSRHAGELGTVQSNTTDGIRFFSGVTAQEETQLQNDHWQAWLTARIDFIGAMQAVKEVCGNDQHEIIEIGFHPVLDRCCTIFNEATYVSSMFRGEDEIKWLMHQRKRLEPKPFLDNLNATINEFRSELDFDTPLAYQGFTSINFLEFSELLQAYFPSLSPQDFYRYKTVNQLIHNFGIETRIELHGRSQTHRNEVVIAGMSCKFPSSAENLTQFWQMLLSEADQVNSVPDRGKSGAGYLNERVTRFDHQYFNISESEARTMDPQQILALELTELLWKDAGLDPANLDRKRIGVYIGAWNQEYRGDNESVYYPTGTNPSIIASRISHHFDLRGPSWVSNTACSSSFIAVHYAAKDIEDGRVDYAIAGGVNMILGDGYTGYLRNSGFLSRDDRCKAFDNSANGYVRAEGGGLVLLVNKNLAEKYYAELIGSSINQNGGRSQIISAPHPEAQEELITDACQDAGIMPQEISYLECHGTGTKIGDPIEISAIQNTVAKDRVDACYLGSVKSNIGHLESAAGIAGLIKSVLILNHGIIPPNLHFNQPNEFIDFDSYKLKVVSEETPIDQLIKIGISSFGFGGANGHVIIEGVAEDVRKMIEDIEIPFDRSRSRPLTDYYQLENAPAASRSDDMGIDLQAVNQSVQPTDDIENDKPDNGQVSREDVEKLVKELFFKLTSIEQIDEDVELTDQGLDSMSVTELFSQLETTLKIDIDPDIIFEHPLPDQLIDKIHSLT